MSAQAFAVGLLALGAGYAALMGAFAVGFRRVARRPPAVPAGSDGLPFVSVIIPARDEEATIGPCVASVLANDYPADRLEVLVVDDRSADGTAAAVRSLMARVNATAAATAGADRGGADRGGAPPERLRLLRAGDGPEEARAHKKRAIGRGVAAARGALILTTDADCLVPPQWVRTMAAAFGDAGAGPGAGPVTAFVSGPVLLRPGRHPLLHAQALEFLGLVAVGAGSIGAGRPTVCNGANVAYRKDVFDALGGFAGVDHLTSGDDELLMQKVAAHTPHRVVFCAAPEAAVVTEPVGSWRAFFAQRRRWASKGAHYPDSRLVALNVGIYFFYLGLLGGALAVPFVPGLWRPVAGAFALKAASEAALLGPACRRFGRGWLMAYFLPAQLLQVPYIVVLAAAGALGGYEWKGRRVAR